METKKKITELIEYLRTELPKGCTGVSCVDCPLNAAEGDSIKEDICDLLEQMTWQSMETSEC